MPEGNVDVLRNVYGAFGRGDVPGVLSAFADDIEWNVAESIAYAGSGPYHGPQEVAEKVFARVIQDIEGFTVTPKEYFAEGDAVVVILHYSGTGAVSGKELDVDVVHAWDFRDGKATRFRQFLDTVKFNEVVPLEVATPA